MFQLMVMRDRLKEDCHKSVNDGLRAEFGKRTILEVVSGERSEIMDILKERADRDSRQIGIEIIDVRLRRVDFTSRS